MCIFLHLRNIREEARPPPGCRPTAFCASVSLSAALSLSPSFLPSEYALIAFSSASYCVTTYILTSHSAYLKIVFLFMKLAVLLVEDVDNI